MRIRLGRRSYPGNFLHPDVERLRILPPRLALALEDR